jgi:hypothetical protein
MPSIRRRHNCTSVKLATPWYSLITSTTKIGPNRRRGDNDDGNEQNAPVRPSLCCAPAAELVRIEINQQVTAGLFVRVLSDADVTGGSELLGIHATQAN